MLRKKIFGSAFIDEVALFNEVKKYEDVKLTKGILKEILNEHGLNQATAIFYKYMLHKHCDFINKINSHQPKATHSYKPIKLIIVPGMFYKEYPEMGGDGLFIKTISDKFDFECELVELDSRGSVLKNKDILKKILLKEKHNNIWLVSFSKGSTETRLCLEELFSEKFTKNIKGWISISGLVKGTFLGDEKLQSPLTKAIWRATSKVLGIDHKISKEMSSGGHLMQNKIILPPDMEIMHIIGVPISSHLQPMLIKRYQRLARFGPNDGIINLSDFLEIPGHVYPLWGSDHFLRLSYISELIYKICNYINTK